MSATSSSGASSTYGYDYTGARAKVANGSRVTYYPETTYHVNGATTTKSIFADGFLVSTIVDATTTGMYQYYRTITVTSTTSIASGTLANFPMLVSSTLSSTAWEGRTRSRARTGALWRHWTITPSRRWTAS